MRSILLYVFLSFCLAGPALHAQDRGADSLRVALGNAKDDTSKVKILKELFLAYEYQDALQAEEYLDEAYRLSEDFSNKKIRADVFILRGYLAEDKAEYSVALDNYLTALRIYESINDKKGVSAASGNVASVFVSLGNYPEALKFLFSALKIDEAAGNKLGVASSNAQIAIVYGAQGNYNESLTMHQKSLDLSKVLKDDLGIAFAYNNIGNVLLELGRYDEALGSFVRSLEIKLVLADERGIGSAYNNIASTYAYLADTRSDPKQRSADLEKAMENARLSLEKRKSIDDLAGEASVRSNMGVIFFKQKKFKEAEESLNLSKKIAVDIGYKEYIRENYFALAQLDSAKGNYKGAYENHKFYVLYRDSLENEETRRKTIQSQMTYDFEKKEAVAEAEHKKELENQDLIAEEKSRKQRLILIFVSGFLLVVALFAVFIFRSLRITKKQKDIIELQKFEVEKQKLQVEHQKTLVEEHQKEIIDSITYARRIQRSLLPTEKYIEKSLARLKKN